MDSLSISGEVVFRSHHYLGEAISWSHLRNFKSFPLLNSLGIEPVVTTSHSW